MSIMILGFLYMHMDINKVLVVAPLSILGVWEEEFKKFAEFPYKIFVLKGTSQTRRSCFMKQAV